MPQTTEMPMAVIAATQRVSHQADFLDARRKASIAGQPVDTRSARFIETDTWELFDRPSIIPAPIVFSVQIKGKETSAEKRLKKAYQHADNRGELPDNFDFVVIECEEDERGEIKPWVPKVRRRTRPDTIATDVGSAVAETLLRLLPDMEKARTENQLAGTIQALVDSGAISLNKDRIAKSEAERQASSEGTNDKSADDDKPVVKRTRRKPKATPANQATKVPS